MVRLGRLLVVLIGLAEDDLVVPQAERVSVQSHGMEVHVRVGALGLTKVSRKMFFYMFFLKKKFYFHTWAVEDPSKFQTGSSFFVIGGEEEGVKEKREKLLITTITSFGVIK